MLRILAEFKVPLDRPLDLIEQPVSCYAALYSYYFDIGAMPYDVAKARDGDPYQWIEERVAHLIGR